MDSFCALCLTFCIDERERGSARPCLHSIIVWKHFFWEHGAWDEETPRFELHIRFDATAFVQMAVMGDGFNLLYVGWRASGSWVGGKEKKEN